MIELLFWVNGSSKCVSFTQHGRLTCVLHLVHGNYVCVCVCVLTYVHVHPLMHVCVLS